MPATKAKATPEDLRRVVKDQPLVSSGEAARLLGIAPPNLYRLAKQGRLPKPVPIKGVSAAGQFRIYIRSEVMELAGELRAERRLRGRNGKP